MKVYLLWIYPKHERRAANRLAYPQIYNIYTNKELAEGVRTELILDNIRDLFDKEPYTNIKDPTERKDRITSHLKDFIVIEERETM